MDITTELDRRATARRTTGLAVTNPRSDIEQLAVNTIRTLCMDAVQAANSGHPGTPMAMAPVAYCLWQKFLRFEPRRATAGAFRCGRLI